MILFIASSEAQLSTNSLVFEMSINEKCASVSVADNDNMEGSRSYQLILGRNGGSTVPVELYPSNIPIIVIDNDGQGKQALSANVIQCNYYNHNTLDANFSIISSMPSFMIQEGDRIDNIRVQKSGNTVLSYNVSLMVMPLTDSASMCNIILYSVLKQLNNYWLLNRSRRCCDNQVFTVQPIYDYNECGTNKNTG